MKLERKWKIDLRNRELEARLLVKIGVVVVIVGRAAVVGLAELAELAGFVVVVVVVVGLDVVVVDQATGLGSCSCSSHKSQRIGCMV